MGAKDGGSWSWSLRVSGLGSVPDTFSFHNTPVLLWLRRAKRTSQTVQSHSKLLFRLGLLRVCSHSNREPLSLCIKSVHKLGITYTLKKIKNVCRVWALFGSWIAHILIDGFARFFLKGQVVKYLRLSGTKSLAPNYSAVQLEQENSHKQYVNDWVWLCSKKTLFTQGGSKHTLASSCDVPPWNKNMKESWRWLTKANRLRYQRNLEKVR